MKILVAEDDADMRALVRFALSQAGFIVTTAAHGSETLAAFATDTPDLLVLDITLPDVDGLQMCREIRRRCAVPILILTARHDENEMIAAFDSGADDYMSKPFSARVLLARVRALARRSNVGVPQSPTVGTLQLDIENRLFRIGAIGIALTPLELRMLHLLIATPGTGYKLMVCDSAAAS